MVICNVSDGHMTDYLMRPSVNAEGSPKEADSIVGRTKSTPQRQLLVEGVDFYGLMGLRHTLVQLKFPQKGVTNGDKNEGFIRAVADQNKARAKNDKRH